MRTAEAAALALNAQMAGLWLFDYHLDDDDMGVALYRRQPQRDGPRPAVVMSADASESAHRTVHEAGLPLLIKPLGPLALKSVPDRRLAARAVR